MVDSSRRAARPVRKGGLANVLFAVAAAERVPAELRELGDLVTMTFPWGSLLRGCVGWDPAVAAGIRSLVVRGGRLELILAPAERDRLPGVPTEPDAVVEACRATFEGLGLAFREGRPASDAELRDSASSWARRLIREGRDRRAVRVQFESP
ncbi:MAG: hypothetical protein HYX54_01635 [Chloroflexi bacterium]|nr:hypothetical protein [Chloroflexota bacterium]